MLFPDNSADWTFGYYNGHTYFVGGVPASTLLGTGYNTAVNIGRVLQPYLVEKGLAPQGDWVSYLAEIGSSSENNFVTDLAAAHVSAYPRVYTSQDGGGAPYVWLGGSDQLVEGQWTWSYSGSALSYANWGSGPGGAEPNNGSGAIEQDGLALALGMWPPSGGGTGTRGQWNDISIQNGLPFVIELNYILGTPTADFLQGSSLDDKIHGMGGDDVISGGAGNDVLAGGEGNDTALFGGPQSAYRFGLDGSVLIVSGPDGADSLISVESLRFDGGAPVLVGSLLSSGLIEEWMTILTNGVTTRVLPDLYSGPVAWLKYQMLGTGAGDVAMGTSQNDFLNLLGGDDAADGRAGDDVLDGGTGSNFLTGGAGRDDFFLDGRGGTTTWATITDWTAGERLSVWGWNPGVSKAQWVDSAGAPGWTGVTMHGDLDGNGVIDTSVTWTGLTRDQLPTPLEFDALLWFL